VGDSSRPSPDSVEYSTPWFELVSKQVGGAKYYSLRMVDYVTVVAITTTREIVLVRQYRPAVDQFTLELPSGHVEKNQTPEDSARSELSEETGFTCPRFELLGTLLSDTGRNQNKTWCYMALDVVPPSASWVHEEGIEVVLVPVDRAPQMILGGELGHALNVAALMLAALRHTIFGVGNGTMNLPR